MKTKDLRVQLKTMEKMGQKKESDARSLNERIKADLVRSENSPPAVPKQRAVPSSKILAHPVALPEVVKLETEAFDPNKTHDILKLLHSEKVLGADGQEHWKLVCACGKRILSPLKPENPYGRCPKCGGRLPLPGHDSDEKKEKSQDKEPDFAVLRVSAIHQPLSQPLHPLEAFQENGFQEMREDRTAISLSAVPKKDEATGSNPNLDAALKAADRLRPSRARMGRAGALATSASGRVSAWPLAGVSRRLLATFIDLTLAISIAGGVLLWRLQNQQFADFDHPLGYLLSLTLLVLGFNDAVVASIFSGSIGKMLVLSVVQHTEGGEPSVPQKIMRAIFKWLLIPGWIIGGFDAQQRTLHDLLCSTTVLKSRRKRTQHVERVNDEG